ncbi:hypothetical protein JOM56_000600, partial [Amanita muscaria]
NFLTQIPQPIHRNSEMKAILSVGFTSIHSFPVAPHQHESVGDMIGIAPILTTGHDLRRQFSD